MSAIFNQVKGESGVRSNFFFFCKLGHIYCFCGIKKKKTWIGLNETDPIITWFYVAAIFQIFPSVSNLKKKRK